MRGGGGGGVSDDVDEEDGKRCEEDHLEDGIEGDKDGAVFGVTAGEGRPDQDHGYTAGYADKDETGAEIGFVREEGVGQPEHEKGRD